MVFAIDLSNGEQIRVRARRLDDALDFIKPEMGIERVH